MNMINQVGEFAYNEIISGVFPSAEVIVTKVTGPVKRGQVVTGTAGGALAVATGALSADDAAYIVASDNATEGEIAAEVYRSGAFNRIAIAENTGYELTEADVEILREKGLVLTREEEIVNAPAGDSDDEDDTKDDEEKDGGEG